MAKGIISNESFVINYYPSDNTTHKQKRHTPFLYHQQFKFKPSYTHDDDIADIDRKYIAPIINDINSQKFMSFEALYKHMHKIGWFYNGIDIDCNHVFRNSENPTTHFHLLKIGADDSLYDMSSSFKKYRILEETKLPYKAYPTRESLYFGTLDRLTEEINYLNKYIDYGERNVVKRIPLRELKEGDFIHFAECSNQAAQDIIIGVAKVTYAGRSRYSNDTKLVIEGKTIGKLEFSIPSLRWEHTEQEKYLYRYNGYAFTVFISTKRELMLSDLKGYLEFKVADAKNREKQCRQKLNEEQARVARSMKKTNRFEEQHTMIQNMLKPRIL
jgi:hypothetical protein